MAYKTFAAIYVGSSEIAMKIYEITGKKTLNILTGSVILLSLRRIPTARDIFQLS